MADLCRVNLALVGISFFKPHHHADPLTCLSFLHISLMRVSKFNWSSMVTPSKLRQSEDSTVFP